MTPAKLFSQAELKIVERVQELRRLFREEEISLENGATAYYDEHDKIKTSMATCGTCHMTWNDDLISERTPVPSGRCPYEYIHPQLAELRKLLVTHKRVIARLDRITDRLLGKEPATRQVPGKHSPTVLELLRWLKTKNYILYMGPMDSEPRVLRVAGTVKLWASDAGRFAVTVKDDSMRFRLDEAHMDRIYLPNQFQSGTQTFDTLPAASRHASQVFDQTGVVLGITEVSE